MASAGFVDVLPCFGHCYSAKHRYLGVEYRFKADIYRLNICFSHFSTQMVQIIFIIVLSSSEMSAELRVRRCPLYS